MIHKSLLIFWVLILRVNDFSAFSQNCFTKIPYYDPVKDHYALYDVTNNKFSNEYFKSIEWAQFGNDIFICLKRKGNSQIYSAKGDLVYNGSLIPGECFLSPVFGKCIIVSNETGFGVLSLDSGNIVVPIIPCVNYKLYNNRYFFRINSVKKEILINDLLEEKVLSINCTERTHDIIPISESGSPLFYYTGSDRVTALFSVLDGGVLHRGMAKYYLPLGDSLILFKENIGGVWKLDLHTRVRKEIRYVEASYIGNTSMYVILIKKDGEKSIVNNKMKNVFVLDRNAETVNYTGKDFLIKIENKWQKCKANVWDCDTSSFDAIQRFGKLIFGVRRGVTINLTPGLLYEKEFVGMIKNGNEHYVVTNLDSIYFVYDYLTGKLIRNSNHNLIPLGKAGLFLYQENGSFYGIESITGNIITDKRFGSVFEIGCDLYFGLEMSDYIKGAYLINGSGKRFLILH